MTEFIIRARAAPVAADRFLAAIGTGLGVEYLAEIIRHGIFISQGHREDTTVSLVLEKSQDFSRIVSISGERLGSLEDLHEMSLLKVIADALRAGERLGKHASVTDVRGNTVTAMSFEQLVRQRTEAGQVFLLDSDGEDIRDVSLGAAPVIVLTDHTPMPKNTHKSMARQGVSKLSLGPVTLHAAQCITLVHNELDRRRLMPSNH